MARIQYRPSAQRRGFNPNKLSTEGISRMREESSRIVQGLRETRAAEAKQAEINLRAMESDAAYTERIIKENNAIQLENLKNRQNQILADIQGEQKQAQTDSLATQTIVESLVNFSDTLGKAAARRTKQMIEDQTKEGIEYAEANYNNIVNNLPGDPEPLQERERAENARVDGTIIQFGEIAATAAETGEDRLETLKNYDAIPGLSGYAKEAALNKLFSMLIKDRFELNLRDPDKKFISASNQEYTGLDALRNVDLHRDLQKQTKDEVYGILNITDPLQIRKGLEEVRDYYKTSIEQTREYEIEDRNENLRQKFNLAEQTGTVEGLTIAAEGRRKVFGPKEMQDGLEAATGDFNFSLEEIKKVKIDNKLWYKHWSNRWEAGLAARNKAIADNLRVERQLIQEEDKAWQRNSAVSIQAAYDQNATQASLLVRKRYLDKGMPVPQWIKNIETAAFAKNKAEVQAAFEQRKRFGILDLPFVNNIKDPTLQKEAREAYDQQQLARYGENAPEILKRLNRIARTLTKIDPNEKVGGPGTYEVEVELRKFYIDALKETYDSNAALNKVRAEVDAANRRDKNSRFFYEDGQNNRRIFPKFQSSDRELAEMRVYIDKQLIKHGADIVNKPFAIANSTQMDAIYASSLAGITQYSPGFLQAADRLNLKPSELFNASRRANNLATGENKPLLTPTPVNQLVESAPAWMQKLFNSGEDSMVARAVASANGNLPRRASMGGDLTSQRQALETAAAELGVDPIDLATIIGFETGGTYDPGVVGGEGGNYQGLIQFGIPERQTYGVVPGMSFEEQLLGPVVNFFKDRFARAGMSTQGATLEDLYTTVIAGNPGANRDAKDSFGTSARSGAARMYKEHRPVAIQRFGF